MSSKCPSTLTRNLLKLSKSTRICGTKLHIITLSHIVNIETREEQLCYYYALTDDKTLVSAMPADESNLVMALQEDHSDDAPVSQDRHCHNEHRSRPPTAVQIRDCTSRWLATSATRPHTQAIHRCPLCIVQSIYIAHMHISASIFRRSFTTRLQQSRAAYALRP